MKMARDALQRRGSSKMFHDTLGASRSGPELLDCVARLAGALSAGLPQAPRIGIWSQNSLSTLEAFLAVEWLGGTRIAVDPGTPAAEASAIFGAAKVDLAIVDTPRKSGLSVKTVFHDNANRLHGDAIGMVEAIPPDRIHNIYPRSVVNGALFGIPLSYGNWQATLLNAVENYRNGLFGPWNEDSELFLSSQQLLHGTGFVGCFPFIVMGLPQVIVDTFEPQKSLDCAASTQGHGNDGGACHAECVGCCPSAEYERAKACLAACFLWGRTNHVRTDQCGHGCIRSGSFASLWPR
jgi:hypothetical protein